MFKTSIHVFSNLVIGKRKFHSTFRAAFGKYLLLTNTASSGVLMLLGDLIEQELNHDLHKNGHRYDYARLARMFTVGLAFGPVHHFYYSSVTKLWPDRNIKAITKKILADQLVMSPICIAQFFYILGALEKKPMKEVTDEFTKKFVPIYTMDWCVWPPVQFLNFYFVPNRYQVTYINFVTMLYNVFLSFMKHDLPEDYEVTLK